MPSLASEVQRNQSKEKEAMSLLANLPASGLLSQMTDKAVVRPPSPRRHIQTRDAEHTHILRTDKTNILIR